MNSPNSSRGRQTCASAIVSAAVFAALAAPASAQEEAEPINAGRRPQNAFAEVNLGVSHTDNAFRSATQEVSDQIYLAGFAVDMARDGRLLDYTLAGNVSWQKYADDTFGSEVLGYFDGTGKWAFVPERFEWFAQESFSKVNTDPRAPRTPQTLNSFNYFTTGPRLRMPLSNALNAELAADYSITDSDDINNVPGTANLSGDSYGGSIALTHDVNRSTGVSLIGDTKRIRYDQAAGANDYDQHEGYVRYRGGAARTSIRADLGYTQISTRSKDSSGLLARLDLSRQVSGASEVHVNAGRRFMGAGDSMRGAVGARGIDDTNSIATVDPYTETSAFAGWRFQRLRTEVGVDAGWIKQAYETQSQFDRKRKTVAAYFGRRMTPQLTLRAVADYTREDFATDNFESKELNAALSLDWRFARTISAAFRLERFDRDTSVATADYTENRYGIQLVYHAIGNR